eukprot:scaffold9668_cov101-Isochrysis_galbana.AAC.2
MERNRRWQQPLPEPHMESGPAAELGAATAPEELSGAAAPAPVATAPLAIGTASVPSTSSAVDHDVAVARERLFAAISSGNLTATREVLESISPSLSSGKLSAECGAAAKVVEILTEKERVEAEVAEARERARQLEARSIAADAAKSRSEAEKREEARRGAQRVAQLEEDLRRAEEREGAAAIAGAALGRVVGTDGAARVEGIQASTRVNELQGVVVSLQTRLRQSEQQVAHAAVRVEAAEAASDPLLKQIEDRDAELAHVRRMLAQADESSTVLQQHLSVLQARMAESSFAAVAAGPGEATGAEEVAAALATGGDPVEALKASLDAERGRRKQAEAEAARARAQASEQLDRMRKGAERSMRELQGQVARLQGEVVRERQSVGEELTAARSKAAAESEFRRRAEEGWQESQRATEAAKGEAGQLRERAAAAEGQLPKLRRDLEQARDELATQQATAADLASKLGESEYREQSSAQQTAAAYQSYQQQATAAAAAAAAELTAAKEYAESDAAQWRRTAEQARSRVGSAATQLSSLRQSVETMLQRLASATELSELSDLSRLLFEVKARLLSVGEALQAQATRPREIPPHDGRSRSPAPRGNHSPAPRRQHTTPHIGFEDATADGARLPPIHPQHGAGVYRDSPARHIAAKAPYATKAAASPQPRAPGGRTVRRGNVRDSEANLLPSRLPKPTGNKASLLKPAPRVSRVGRNS